MSENIQTKDKPDPKIKDKPNPKRSIGVIVETTIIILGAYSAGIILGHLLKNFSFSFVCSYNKEYEEEEEGMFPPPLPPLPPPYNP